MKDKFLTAQEASEILKCNIMTIYRYIKSGKLVAYKLGKEFRIKEIEFNKFIEKRKVVYEKRY
jgi:excisionase family DNA binding protein